MTNRHRVLALAAAVVLFAQPARAEWMQPDPAYREAKDALRDAARDTSGHAADPARLAALGAAQLRLARGAEAEKTFRRVLELESGNKLALAGLGKLALHQQRQALADSLLALAGDAEGAARDRYDSALRRGDWKAAQALAETVEDEGRTPLLERLAETPAMALLDGPAAGFVNFERAWPVPLVKVKLNGTQVLMAVDFGASEMIIDPSAANFARMPMVGGERTLVWNGGRMGARNTIAQNLNIAGFAFTNVPAAVTSLHKYSLHVNPQGVTIAGVIGYPVLRAAGVTLDFRANRLELRRDGGAVTARGTRVPFELWGANEMVVYGSVNGGRRMALSVGTALPEAGLGAPAEVFEEVGVKPGKMANALRSAGMLLQGRPWAQVIVPTISLGPIVSDKVPGWSGAVDSNDLWRHGMRRDALLGPAFFRGRRVSPDWTKAELVFEDK